MAIHPQAGQTVPLEMIPDIPKLICAYYTNSPDPDNTAEQVSFGTSGHRGSSVKNSFNEAHILATTQAICDYRLANKINGPLFMGKDTHALSEAAFNSALEVLAANEVQVFIQSGPGYCCYTPTPVISHAILKHNTLNTSLADGIIVTPSHNPPDDGGFKYNPPSGGPADSQITDWVQNRANELIKAKLQGVKRLALNKALQHAQQFDFVDNYVSELDQVVDMAAIAQAKLKIGVDPLGGSGIAYWEYIAQRYGLDLEVVNPRVDPTFSFMRLDRDGKIRMDCSSPWAMAGLIELKEKFDISFGNDPDYDRHGIVTKSGGLLNPNHYLAVAVWYLFQNRNNWPQSAAIGKTLVSSSMLDRVAGGIKRKLEEVPVGFKWFVQGLLDGSYGFGGEESAGASFLRFNGKPWTTDKDGIIMDLLAAEITARSGKDPAQIYQQLELEYGSPIYERTQAPATGAEKAALKKLSADQVKSDFLAGEKILHKLTHAPGNNAPIGGLKISTENGWFAARPSGTEDIYKIYAESFLGQEHLQKIRDEAQQIVNDALN